jgi:hypothetical protein
MPWSSTATHNEDEGHDTPSMMLVASTSEGVQVADAPSAGSAEVRTLPLLSTATHSDVDGHETPVRRWTAPSTPGCSAQVAAAPSPRVGRSQGVASLSTATHSEVDGHDIPLSVLLPLTALVVQTAVEPSIDKDSRR